MKPRGVLIAGNWKMNHGPQAAGSFFQELARRSSEALSAATIQSLKRGELRACVIPPAVTLQPALAAASKLPFPVSVGAQNAHWEKSGAFTGELSAPLLLELGVKTCLVGHSERRQFFGETDETARKRVEGLIAQGIEVILCIGETRQERESGQTQAVLLRQLGAAFPRDPAGRVIIAYEPVWAIGTGLTATPAQAEEAHQIIRKFLWDRLGMEGSGKTQILYGGSVTPENASSLLACPNIDGALVGGASLKAESFLLLLEAGGKALAS